MYSRLRLLLVLFIYGLPFSPKCLLAQDLDSFQSRSKQLLELTADVYEPPTKNIGDPEKYYWPKAMARLQLYGSKDSIANAWIKEFAQHPPFHFTLVGMARLLYQFPDAPAVAKYRDEYLRQVFARQDSYNAWTAEGTENHISMSRTSGYLYAQLAAEGSDTALAREALLKKAQMKTWILDWAYRATTRGTGEWNSGIYEVFNLLGWLNLYDFAKDSSVRQAASMVVHYYTTEMALHYSYGVIGGSEMRGTGAGLASGNAYTYWCWLWFGNRGMVPDFTKSGDYIQSVHAALSTYRPEPALVKLALKDSSFYGSYKGLKANYTLEQPGRVSECFYVGPGFTLGHTKTPFGGWTGTTSQMLSWKLVVARSDRFTPDELSGNGRYFDTWSGRMRDPYTQFGQRDNVLIQITKVPVGAEQIQDSIDLIVKDWGQQWRKDYNRRFPKSPQNFPKNVVTSTGPVLGNNVSYLSVPKHASIYKRGNSFYFRLNQVYLRAIPLGSHQSIRQVRYRDHGMGERRYALCDSAKRGIIAGWVLIVEPYEGVDTVMAMAKLNDYRLAELDSLGKHFYKIQKVENALLTVAYADSGTYEEPIVDWGFGPSTPMTLVSSPPLIQPTWPSGAHHGRILLEHQPHAEQELAPTFVYKGKNLKIGDGTIWIQAKDSSYLQSW